MPRLIAPLPEGPLDILGDIHGEIDALRAVLERLGVDVAARRAPRPLVFVGDLVDRGPDSVAVVQLVADLVEKGQAHVVLGNHELNLLQADRKEGNGWAWDGLGPDGQADHFTHKVGGVGLRRPFDSRLASAAERRFILDFLGTLPLVLERPDLRVVHAAPHAPALASLPVEADVVAMAAAYDREIHADLEARGVLARARAERSAWAELRDFNLEPTELLENVAIQNAAEQAGNPISVLTSGLEERVPYSQHFYAGGKWRFVSRSRWWRGYGAEASAGVGPPPPFTVVGHYWRRRSAREIADKANTWANGDWLGWAGPLGRAFCVDFSVGRRFAERADGRASGFAGGLGALRWPEGTLIFDDSDDIFDTRPGVPCAE